MSHHHALVTMPLTYIQVLRQFTMGCVASRVKCKNNGYQHLQYHQMLPPTTPAHYVHPHYPSSTPTPIGLWLYVVLDITMCILCSINILMHYAVPPGLYVWSPTVPLNVIIVALYTNVVVFWKSLWHTVDIATTTGIIYAGPADHCRGFNTSSRLLCLAYTMHLTSPCAILHLLNHPAPPDPVPRLHTNKENNVQNVEVLQAYNGPCASSYSGRVPSSVVTCTPSDDFISRLLTSVLCDPPSQSTTDVYIITTPDFYCEIYGILIPMS